MCYLIYLHFSEAAIAGGFADNVESNKRLSWFASEMQDVLKAVRQRFTNKQQDFTKPDEKV